MSNINQHEFIKTYFHHYKLIEEEFCNTFKYVEPVKDNFNSFSNTYLKLILSIGSEILILLNFVINLYNLGHKNKGFSITEEFINYEPDFESIEVLFQDMIIYPWNHTVDKPPKWWTAYNTLKHDRCGKKDGKDNYTLANLENVLYSLAALHTLEMYAFRKISIDLGNEIFVPLSKSVFAIINSHWKDCPSNTLSIFNKTTGMLTISKNIY